MNPDTTPTPRWEIKISADGITPYLWDNRKYDNYDLGALCRILNEYEEKTNEVARLRKELKEAKKACLMMVDSASTHADRANKYLAENKKVRELLEELLGIEHPVKQYRPSCLILEEYRSLYLEIK